MPIKKRTSLPLPPTRKIEPYKLPGKPLSEVLRHYDREASDAAWSGATEKAERYTARANDVRNRLQAGELYEVDF